MKKFFNNCHNTFSHAAKVAAMFSYASIIINAIGTVIITVSVFVLQITGFFLCLNNVQTKFKKRIKKQVVFNQV